MESIGWPELLVIGLVFVLLFGSKKIPEMAKGLGEGIRNFKTAIKGEVSQVKDEVAEVKKEVEKA